MSAVTTTSGTWRSTATSPSPSRADVLRGGPPHGGFHARPIGPAGDLRRSMFAWQTRRMGRPDDSWRVEADDEWLAGHRSQTMGRFHRRFSRILTVGDAVSQAELGPFAGAPRSPQLRVA